MSGVPDGFAPAFFRKSPATDPWEPLYSRRGEAVVELGMAVAPPHCNSRGFAHGGVIAALADNAMGLSLGAARMQARIVDETPAKALTVSLSVDYVGSAKVGQWLQITPRVLKAGRSLGFVDAVVTADGEVVARASATFRVT